MPPPLLTTTPHQREDVSALDRFNVHRCPTRRVLNDESKFSLSSDFIAYSSWRERGSRTIPEHHWKGTKSAMGLAVPFSWTTMRMSHRTVAAAEQLLERAARTLLPVTIRELRLALQDEWAAMPQQLIDTLILSMGRR
ncbi:hypothetical protein TNCV_2591921 [Trichonephila clavipes]|nr:hypothetical protein TNCV_2591921 [Trichonephila clavipes]